eukprot:gene25361-biopygen2989
MNRCFFLVTSLQSPFFPTKRCTTRRHGRWGVEVPRWPRIKRGCPGGRQNPNPGVRLKSNPSQAWKSRPSPPRALRYSFKLPEGLPQKDGGGGPLPASPGSFRFSSVRSHSRSVRLSPGSFRLSPAQSGSVQLILGTFRFSPADSGRSPAQSSSVRAHSGS